MIQTLHIVKEYKKELIYPALCRAFEALGIAKDIHPGMKVAIKPNLILAKSPDVSATTHPMVIQAVARWLKEHGVTDITLAESSGGLYTAEYMGNIYKVCGMKQLEPEVKLNMDFSAKTVNCPEDFANHSFHIISPILEADYVINICKLKTHAMTGYSGGIKNLFGVIPGLEKPQLHYLWPDNKDFSRMLIELAQMVSPQVTIIDAIEAMEGNGPTGGTVYPMHMLFAARDFYTQDYFAAKLMGLDPMKIEMIAQAVSLGLAKPAEIKLIGDSVPENITPFRAPDSLSLDFSDFLPGIFGKLFAKFAARVLKSYPQVNKDICVGCGKCAESCPAHIIEIKNRKAVFRKKGCISCFCCQEMCPVKAISVKKAL